MKHSSFLLGLIAASVLLVGCSSEPTQAVQYQLDMNVTSEVDQIALAEASLRVIERRLEYVGGKVSDKTADLSGEKPVLKVTIEERHVEPLTERLMEPILFHIMEEAGEDEADVVVEGHGGFAITGVQDDDLYAAQAGEDANGKGYILLEFTEEGREELAEVFKRNNGKSLGLFVRGQLASKLAVDGAELKDQIIIDQLPSPEIARIFADDLNVGLHVRFTPLP